MSKYYAPTPQQAAQKIAANNKGLDGFKWVSTFAYHRADGTLSHFQNRFDHESGRKEFRPMMEVSANCYVISAPPRPRPLYRLPDLLAADPAMPVFVVEGEKCADALAALGLVATTSGSCSSADSADWKPLRGRRVVIWPDNDEPGRKYARAVAERIAGVQA